MTDCDCPCHGDSEDAPSHEDGDCCPALAEADEALARALSENGRVLRREAAEIVALLDEPPHDPRQTELPLWSAVPFDPLPWLPSDGNVVPIARGKLLRAARSR